MPNDFVVTLCEVMDLAASSVHETAVSNPPPTRIPTPYGGQLKWTLPGGTILTAHLKDKDKIRHKKRWSQVCFDTLQWLPRIVLLVTLSTRTNEESEISFIQEGLLHGVLSLIVARLYLVPGVT